MSRERRRKRLKKKKKDKNKYRNKLINKRKFKRIQKGKVKEKNYLRPFLINYTLKIVHIELNVIQYQYFHVVIKHILVHNVMDLQLILQGFKFQVIDIVSNV